MAIRYRKRPLLIASAAVAALLGTAALPTLELIADYEGYVPEAYRDPVGIWTKCFGDTRDVTPGMTYTDEQCVRSLNEQVLNHAAPIFKCVPELEHQHDYVKSAMVSMAYNTGVHGFCTSTVARRANADDWEGACKRMSEIYVTAGGQRLPGLVKRRKTESELCLRGLQEAGR